MKVEAQIDNKPTIRNIAKLVNELYVRRFGMRTDATRVNLIDLEQLEGLGKQYLILNKIPLGSLFLVSYTLSQGPLEQGNKNCK